MLYVTYDIFGKSHRAGPYATQKLAECHRDDIAGFEGVSNVKIVPQEARCNECPDTQEESKPEPKRAIERILESE